MTTPPFHLDLQGRWFITRSNFPMWLTGKKTNPTFNYSTAVDRHGRPVLLDRVESLKRGAPDTIRGVDTPGDDEPGAFCWRGTGVLKLLTSRWRVLLLEDTRAEAFEARTGFAVLSPQRATRDRNDGAAPLQFLIVQFEKTLFTPAGYDVVCRRPVPDAALDAAIDEALLLLGVTASITPILQT